MGRYMSLLAWGLGIALIAWLFANMERERSIPTASSLTTPEGTREVRLTLNRYNHYVTHGEINKQPVVFFLDTGASMVSVPEKIARQLGLKAGQQYVVNTAKGDAHVFATRIPELSIGPIKFTDVVGSINPHTDDDKILLGMTVLKNLELIQRGKTLIMRQYIR